MGFSKEDIQEDKGDGYTLLSFFEEGEKDVLYNVALVFYEDETVEVLVRKPLCDYDIGNILLKINELNSRCCGVTYLVANDMLVLKTYCKTDGEIDVLLRELVKNIYSLNF